MPAIKRDPHSYYGPGQPTMTHLHLQAQINFATRTISCTATIDFGQGGTVDLDVRDLTIEAVTDNSGQTLEFQLHESKPVLGQRLNVMVPEDEPRVNIRYHTSPEASGIQWLSAEQTKGKRHPYLFTQFQALHAPSLVPCQNTPNIRFSYSAEITVPKALRALMAANHLGREEQGELAIERYRMPQRIPAYLMAIAVGDLVSRDITDRCRVWSEVELVDAAAAEFAQVGQMMDVAEGLFGPYDWERFDLLILPPSFPYGGMENPRLTFLTPTLIPGGAAVVGHELAHSWTGNLIGNADWRSFWLNEGWTTYIEWRIYEALHGRDAALLQMALRGREFSRDCHHFITTGTPELTALSTHISCAVDPDDIFSRVPYFEGAMFIRAIEERVGRERFDRFIRAYIARFRFTAIDTATFLDFVASELPGALEQVQAWRYVYEPGWPENAPKIESLLIDDVARYAEQSIIPPREVGQAWSDPQWTLYLELLPRPATPEFVAKLDIEFNLSTNRFAEIKWAFLLLAVESGYTAVDDQIERFLVEGGRMKYVLPLMRAKAKTVQGLAWARRVFEQVKAGYHPITNGQVERILREAELAK